MGLDMYLEARKYESKIDWRNVPQGVTNYDDYIRPEYLQIAGLFPEGLTKFSESGHSAGVNIAYWRKANQIHGWFVKNVQDDEDDCREYYVSTEKLQELLDTVTKVIDGDVEVAKELLPVTSGFFFGNYDTEDGYDEYYFKDLEYTRDMLTNLLDKLETNSELSVYYHASW